MKKKTANFMMLVAIALLFSGCATTRTVRMNTATADALPGTFEERPGEFQLTMGYWKSWFEPGVQDRTNQVVENIYHGQEGELYHQKAMVAARHAEVIQPPTVAEEGALPVAFINESRYETRQFIYWERPFAQGEEKRFVVDVAPGKQVTKYLQRGLHYVQINNQYGRPVGMGYSSDAGNYRHPFKVHQTPVYVDQNGNQFFGFARTF